MRKSTTNDGIYYFLGNISSHILHALPLYEELGGTFIVLSEKAKKEVEKYQVPVINIDNKPRKWQKFGPRIKPIYHYLEIDNSLRNTCEFLNQNAKVVMFYELYDFAEPVRLTKPKTVFLTHGNMLKDYMANSNRLTIIKQYDYMAALGPFLKKRFTEQDRIDQEKLVDIGIARTDEIYKRRGQVEVSSTVAEELAIDPKKPVFAYMPTYWGPSSIYNTGKEIVRSMPSEYTLIFRPHPQTPKKILREYFKIINRKPNVIYVPERKYKNVGLLDIFAMSSVIIGDVSSVMLDAILTEKPLIFAYDLEQRRQQKNEYSSIQKVVNASQIINTHNIGRIPVVLKAALKSSVDLKVWRETERLNYYHSNGTSVEAIVHFIKKLI